MFSFCLFFNAQQSWNMITSMADYTKLSNFNIKCEFCGFGCQALSNFGFLSPFTFRIKWSFSYANVLNIVFWPLLGLGLYQDKSKLSLVVEKSIIQVREGSRAEQVPQLPEHAFRTILASLEPWAPEHVCTNSFKMDTSGKKKSAELPLSVR